jgi:hypothetical protein
MNYIKKFIVVMCMLVSGRLNAYQTDWHIETVLGYVIDRSVIVFQVYDGGCTQSEDFSVQVDRKNSIKARVTLFRIKADYCKAFFPYGRMMKFSYKEIGIKRNESFVITNPINPGFVRY